MKNNPYKVLTIILLAVLLTFPIKAGLESLFSGSKSSTILTQPSSKESNTLLTSSVDQKYSNLQKYVKEEKWSEASEETKQIMLTIAGKESEGSLTEEDLIRFPCDDIGVINAIWNSAWTILQERRYKNNESYISKEKFVGEWLENIGRRTVFLHKTCDNEIPPKMRCSLSSLTDSSCVTVVGAITRLRN